MARLHTFATGGWLYEDKFFDDDCIVEVLIEEGRLSPAAREVRAEDNIEAIIETEALSQEEQADSDVIPHEVITATGALIGEICHRCLAVLDPDTAIAVGVSASTAMLAESVDDWIENQPERPSLRLIVSPDEDGGS